MIDLDLDHILFIDRIRDWPIMVRLSSPTKTSLRIASGQIQPVWREPKMNVKKERVRESYIIAKIWKFSQKYFKIFAEKIFRINFEANFFDCLKSCFQLILRKNILIFSLWFSEKKTPFSNFMPHRVWLIWYDERKCENWEKEKVMWTNPCELWMNPS